MEKDWEKEYWKLWEKNTKLLIKYNELTNKWSDWFDGFLDTLEFFDKLAMAMEVRKEWNKFKKRIGIDKRSWR